LHFSLWYCKTLQKKGVEKMLKSFYIKFEKMQKNDIQKKLNEKINKVNSIEEKIKKLEEKRIKEFEYINNANEYLK
jgi:predicted phage-related endonuclease